MKEFTASEVPTILVECPVLLPSVRVGVLDILKRLEKQGRCIVYFKCTFEVKKKDLVACDIVISVRGCENMSFEIVQAAKKLGCFLIYYLDDDLLDLPQTAISSEYYQRTSIRNNIKKMIYLSDVLWSNNEKIIEKYSKYGKKDLRCVQNDIIAPDFLRIGNRENQEKIKILYAGSIDHTYLVEKYVLPAIIKVVEKYPDRVEFVLIGVEPRKSKIKQIQMYKFIEDYNEYRKLVKEGEYDIGLGVIEKTHFYQCKYYNKFLEYTSMGIAGIYTDTLPYTSIVKNHENGILVNNTIEAWFNGICSLIEEPLLRAKCVKNAQELVESKFNETYILKCLVEELPEVVSFKAINRGCVEDVRLKNGKIVYVIQRLHDYWRENKILFIPKVIVAGIGVILRNVRAKRN